MKIIDLSEENTNLYFHCLEDWNDTMKESGNRKECWYHKIKEKGLRVKLALSDSDVIGGMIQYIPIEYSFAEGKDLYFISCIWVHGYKKGRGDFTKKGMGTLLLNAAEEDVKQIGAKGLAAWGIPLPFWMRASWYKKHGYKKAAQNGLLGEVLLWKPFANDAVAPKWIPRKKVPQKTNGKVNVTIFNNGWCSAYNIVYERAKRAAQEYPDKVVLTEYDTFDRNILYEWGISDALFIDGKEVRMGPPPSYEKIISKIEKRVKKLSK